MHLQTLTSHRRPLTGLGLIGLASLAVLAVIYVLTVRTVPGRTFGDLALRGALRAGSLARGSVDAVLDLVSTASLLGATAAVATVALVRLARLQGLAAIGLMVLSNGTTWLLKEVALGRPDLGLDEVAPSTLNSLPSGHSTAVFSAVAALAFVMPARGWPPVVLGGSVAATVVGMATMSAGWHRAGDSVAAFSVVSFWTAVAAAAVVVLRRPREADQPPVSFAVLRWPAVYAVGATLLGGTLALALDASSLQDTAGSLVALVAAFLVVSGAASGAAVGVMGSLCLRDSALDDGPDWPRA